MARQEVYTTVIKLNSEEAKNRLKELEDRVARLKKAKQDAFSAGDSRLGASLAKDLKAAEREMKQFKNSTMSVKETLDNLSSASLGQLEKAARHLKGQMKAASDPSDFAKLDAQLSKVKEQMLALKGATRKADEEARRMTATVSNLKHASLNDLNFTASKLRSQMADYDPTSTMYASRASQLKLVEAELERIRQSEQKVVTLMQQYDKEIDRTNVDIKETKRQMQLVNNTMANLKTSSIRDLEYSIKALNQQMHGMERGTEQFKQMELKAKQLKAELQAVRAEGVAQESWIKRSADWFNRMQGIAFGAVAAISGITFTVKKCVEEYAKMDDEMTNVRKYTGQAAEEVERMNEDFKKMDTRTPRQKLNQLAEDAGRLGITSTAAVEEFVDGADKINVALGDDLGDKAVSQIGKLAQMFGEDKTKGLRGAMLATGSAVNELAQNSSASAGYLVDFTARVAGVGKQAGFTQAQIMGLASVLDQNMQQDETAATAVQNLLAKMFQDSSKFAKIAGLNVKDFAKTLKEDANGALLQFLAAMRAKGGFADLAPMFEEMKMDGSRATGVLTVLADKLDDIKTAQNLANEAYSEGTSVLNEFETQNESVQAQLDKASKKFLDLSIELGQKLYPAARYCISAASLGVRALSTLVDFVKDYWRILIVLTAAIVTYTAVSKAKLIAEKAQMAWLNIMILREKAHLVLVGLKTSALKTMAIVQMALTREIKLTTAAQMLWNKVLLANPITAVIAVVAGLTAAIVTLSKETSTAEQAQRDYNDAVTDANKQAAEEEASIMRLVSAIQSNTTAESDRKAALEELNGKLMREHLGNITEEAVRTGQATRQIQSYIDWMKKKIVIDGLQKKLAESIAKQAENEDLLSEADNDKRGFWAKVWGRINPFASRKTKMLNLASDNREAFRETVNHEIERERQYQQKLIDKIKQLESQHFEINDPEPWRNNGYNGKANDGTIIEQKSTTGTHQVSEKERKARVKAEKVAAAEARKRQAEAKRKQKQAADSIKAETNELMADNAKAYAEGKKTYQQFVDDRQNIQIKGFAKLKQLYGAESNEYKQLLDNQVNVVKQHDAAIQKMNEQTIERERLQKEASIKAQYNDASSDIYQNDIALNEALYKNDVEAMKKRLALYKDREGSEEWLDLKAEMEQAELDHQLQMQETYQNQLRELRQQFGKQDLQAQETMYLNGLDNLYKQGLIKEEEYQQMKLQITKQFAAQRAQIDADDHGAGSAQLKINDKSSEMANSARAAAGESQSTGNATLGGYFSSQIENYQNTMEKLKELYGNDKQNHAAYMQAKAQVTADFLDNMVQQTSAAYNGINNILSSASAYAQACSDLEQAKISKNYEKQIAAAGKNSKKKKKLEEKRDKELAAAKSKANKKAMKIEIAQAIASTAMAAINAYSSAASIPVTGWVMAPIAAGMATAAGMLQIATIKKQHQAEAAGYYEGGYTGGNRYRKEAGVVHEGEFVANHNAVNNSSIRPALDLIDRAQRSNTVGSLTADDITRSLGQGGSTVVAPVVNVNNDNTEVRQSLDGVNAAVSRLTQTLDDGIEVEVPISGRRGLHRRLQDYQRILNNK
ncbi:phage tail tape measure protein [Prevotella copri]|uniref:Phage tail tape measure protein n=1 Tax=Segatella copri TaxID=165179 RepID=A0A646HEQ9_9BACT|nr:phage tail tape measure protein [Segatella copri]MQN91065.1 phage tail tape measure protein [Segatella copri]MQO76512.1 phage tail tape measure protein [Segatella copri]